MNIINISLLKSSPKSYTSANINLATTSGSRSYYDLVEMQQQNPTSVTSYDWQRAWKQQQMLNERQSFYQEDHHSPTSLLLDVISSLPHGSNRRKNYENLKNTFDGSAPNVGYGLDTMSRESYRDLKRLTRQSDFLQRESNNPLPSSGQLIGSEEGSYASNLQGWKPSFINASRPVSDALGSHSDTDFSISKDATGPLAFLPSSSIHLVDGISSSFGDEVEGAYKHHQSDMLPHTPSRTSGSLRQLSTCSDPVLSVPFEIASDVYTGLRKVMDEVSNLLDIIMSNVTKFVTTFMGGLTDGLFPVKMFQPLLKPILNLSSKFAGLFSMLGGFSALSNIAGVVSKIAGGLGSVLGNIAKLASLLGAGAGAAAIVGGLAGKSLGCNSFYVKTNSGGLARKVLGAMTLGGVIGSHPSVGKGMGNLGAMLGKGIPLLLGQSTKNNRNLAQILSSLLPAGIGSLLDSLFSSCCSIGMTGNRGYSVGSSFDSLRNNSFDKCLSIYASHTSIVSPLFGKKSQTTGGYATEGAVLMYEDAAFVRNAQGNKGFTMVGPGGSTSYRPFGSYQAPSSNFARVSVSTAISF